MQFTIFNIFLFLNFGYILSGKCYRAQFKTVCGQIKRTNRIVGGTNADLGEFPWFTRIGVKSNPNKDAIFYCGGSLITDLHILTAEHCFYDVVRERLLRYLIVSLGDHSRNGSEICVDQQCSSSSVIYNVEKIFVYDFVEWTFQNDIAIIKLANKVEFTKSISPICLPDNISPSTMIGEKVLAIGFGLVNSHKRKTAKILQKITITIKPKNKCRAVFSDIGRGQICAGKSDRDTCDGDSGGPLFKLLAQGDGLRYTQLGIVSFGSELCENRHPAVYTDVNYFLKWIDSYLDG